MTTTHHSMKDLSPSSSSEENLIDLAEAYAQICETLEAEQEQALQLTFWI